MNGRAWTDSEIAYLVRHYPNGATKLIAAHLGRAISSIYNQAEKLEIRKTPEYLEDPANRCHLVKGEGVGREYRFSEGHVPANLGLRRPGWHAGRMKETQFQKGARHGAAARKWCPVGTIKSDPDGYLRIKVREAVHGTEPAGFGNTKVWPFMQRHIWEQVMGPIPPKHIVSFKDGDRNNCVFENLELMSLADNCRRNSMWKVLPRELAEAMQLNGQLKRKIRSLSGKE